MNVISFYYMKKSENNALEYNKENIEKFIAINLFNIE